MHESRHSISHAEQSRSRTDFLSSFSDLGDHPTLRQVRLPMLIGLVMVFALLAVGFGYVVFANTATRGGIFWDVGFLVFAFAFVVAFVTVIWRHAASQFSRDRDSERDN